MTELDFLTDKMIDVGIASSLGILIMVLHRRADKRIHEMVEHLHDYITKEHREVVLKIHEMLEAEKKIDDEVHNMVEKQKKLMEELHSMSVAEQSLDQNVHNMVLEQQKLIKELHEASKKDALIKHNPYCPDRRYLTVQCQGNNVSTYHRSLEYIQI